MSVKLNASGAAYARSLIAAGNYDDTAAWSFSAEDGDQLLGPKGDDWANYDRFHLGEDTAESDGTKAKYKYPFGKTGKVYGQALRAIRSRASAQDLTDIYDEAGKLLDLIKAKSDKKDSAKVLPFARAAAPSGYRMAKAAPDAGEIYLYGPIGASMWGGGISANQFAADLKALGAVKTIDLRINSEGGDVFDGKAIYSLLQNHKATVAVHIDGLAASAASFIAMAGNSIEIAEGGFVMIHNAWGFCMGDANEMRRTADLLEMVNGTIADVYAARTKQKLDQIRSWMNDETWMPAKDALARGFADTICENVKVAASVREPARFRNLPRALLPRRAAAQAAIAKMRAAQA